MPYTVHHKISGLIIKHLRGELTAEERTELDEWMASSHENKLLYDELTTEETLAKEVKSLPEIKTRILKAIYKNLPAARPVIPMYRRPAFRWIAAACILLVTGYVLWVTIGRKSEVGSQKTEVAKTNDVPAPKETRAVITLADGRKVYLDSAGNGTIAQQNNVAVVKNSEGGIQYMSPAGGGDLNESSNNKRPGVDYNTLFNPRGSKVISLTLSDGTKVWLNSESSLKYPIAFAGNTREVQITGEAYFEVKHNSQQPFKVHLPNGSVVEDIGTSFNINSYSDENDIKTTLIEGSVRVLANSQQLTANSQILKPGQQAVLNPANPSIRRILVQTNVDVEEVMAWKNGTFNYNGADLQTIMREVARWYDVEIVFEKNVNEKFYAEVSRSTNVSSLLKMLETTKAVKFRVEGKKIIVTK